MRERIAQSNYDISPHRAELFWLKVEKSDGCWQWTGSTSPDGYGKFGGGGKWPNGNLRLVLAHVYSWVLAGGVLDENKELDHTCFNRSCVNPSHLELVTPKVNTLRMHRKNRKTECNAGHDITQVKPNKQGKRSCPVCMSGYQKKYRTKKRLANA